MNDEAEVRSDSTVLPETESASGDNSLAARLAAVGELPAAVLSFLVRAVPARELWKWLGDEERVRLHQLVTRGFQQNARALNQPPVRKRLEHHLAKSPDDVAALIELWSAQRPPVLAEVREQPADALIGQLPALWSRFGSEALLLALLQSRADDAVVEAFLALDMDETSSPTEDDGDEVQSKSTVLVESDTPAELTTEVLQKERDEAVAAAQAARVEVQAAAERVRHLTTELSDVTARTSREVQNATADARKNERRANDSELALAETKKLLDRTARRQRHVEVERDELLVENKRLKKQLRQAQQIQEELRKQLSSAAARLDVLAPKNVDEASEQLEQARDAAAATSKKAPRSPADTTFVWVSDGRKFSVTPREVARAINSNDEDFVFHLIQSFESLQTKNDEGFKLFRKSVRDLDPYYEHVLTRETTRVLVDASNVVRYEVDSRGRGRLGALLQMRTELRRRDCFPISIYADASLRHFIDKPRELLEMAARGELHIVDKGVEADEILAREARRSGAYVVTNDRSFHLKVSPDFEPPRITFRILDSILVLDEF